MYQKQIIICFLCLFVSPLTEAASPNSFVLRGNVKRVRGYNIEKVYLRSVFNSQISDSSMVTNGEYEFKGVVNAPLFVILSCKPFTSTDSIRSVIVQGKMWRKFFIEPTQISVTSRSDFGNMKIKGSKLNAEWESWVMQNQGQDEAVKNETANKTNEYELFNFEMNFQYFFGPYLNNGKTNKPFMLCFTPFIP